MNPHQHKPHRGPAELPGDAEPGALPVEPDLGPAPPLVPADPDGDLPVAPEI